MNKSQVSDNQPEVQDDGQCCYYQRSDRNSNKIDR